MVRLFGIALLVAACRSPDLRDPALRAEVGDRVVSILAAETHYFGDDAERLAFSDRLGSIARSAEEPQTFYAALAQALAGLNEGHTAISAGDALPAAAIPPVALAEAEGEIFVAGVAPGIEGGGLAPGDLLLEVDGATTEAALREQMRSTAGSTEHGRRARAIATILAGPTGLPARVRVRGLDGRERIAFPLRFLLDDGGADRFQAGFARSVVHAAALDLTTVYAALPDLQERRAREMEEALRPFRDMPRLLLDLRGNPGGRIRTVQTIAGLFLGRSETVLTYVEGGRKEEMKSRRCETRFGGSITVLVDGRTGSAAELLALGLRETRGARIVGATTAGSTRSRVNARLPGGATLHYGSAAEFRGPGGEIIEGVGVGPDRRFLPRRQDYAGALYDDPRTDPLIRFALASD